MSQVSTTCFVVREIHMMCSKATMQCYCLNDTVWLDVSAVFDVHLDTAEADAWNAGRSTWKWVNQISFTGKRTADHCRSARSLAHKQHRATASSACSRQKGTFKRLREGGRHKYAYGHTEKVFPTLLHLWNRWLVHVFQPEDKKCLPQSKLQDNSTEIWGDRLLVQTTS